MMPSCKVFRAFEMLCPQLEKEIVANGSYRSLKQNLPQSLSPASNRFPVHRHQGEGAAFIRGNQPFGDLARVGDGARILLEQDAREGAVPPRVLGKLHPKYLKRACVPPLQRQNFYGSQTITNPQSHKDNPLI
jgi:hypothetical protein